MAQGRTQVRRAGVDLADAQGHWRPLGGHEAGQARAPLGSGHADITVHRNCRGFTVIDEAMDGT